MPYIPKQYDSAVAFLKGYGNLLGNIIDHMDSQRVKAYHLYDDLYHNRPETFKVTLRGDSDVEIYLPSTKLMVDSTARFLAVKFDFALTGGNHSEADTYMRELFKRETVQRKFVTAKKSGLTRGDAVWHITGDFNKPFGQKISIHTVHPSCYFPIEEGDRVVGVHLVDLVPDPRQTPIDKTKLVARRQTYRKDGETIGGAVGQITTELRLYELGGWDDRNLSPTDLKPLDGARILVPKKLLPKEIAAIPVYLVPNNVPDGSSWGMSQVAGIEYVINAINQSTTYEDLALVLQGLGVYVTSASPPTGPDGRPGKYRLHPGNVVEIGTDDDFKRVTGVAAVTPFQDHMKWLKEYAQQGLGLPDMAIGTVDVATAESGIALALKMGPILAENEDKQLTVGGIWDQIGHDLLMGWLPALEGIETDGITWATNFGDPMPKDRVATVDEIIALKTGGLLLIDEARQKMKDLGYDYKPGLTEELLEEATKIADAEAGTQDTGELGDIASMIGTDPTIPDNPDPTS